jgi:phenylacetate-CoA ligase
MSAVSGRGVGPALCERDRRGGTLSSNLPERRASDARALWPAPSPQTLRRLVEVFQRAARAVPAYRKILEEAGVRPDNIRSEEDFRTRVPVIDKAGTFGRFDVADLCADGRIQSTQFILPSSGHGGLFSYGAYTREQAYEARGLADAALNAVLGVKERPTLLVNCLPMGVKVPASECAVAEVSVRPDMATAVVRQFGPHYRQVLLVSDAAIIKSVLELGQRQGLRWDQPPTHVLVGGETLAENARSYLGGFLGTDFVSPERGLVASSMGLAEIGLNLFIDVPVWSGHPRGELIRLRRALHRDAALRESVLGAAARITPMVLTYDPRSLFIEVLPDGSLVLTPLDPERMLPLVRYKTGDRVDVLRLDAGEADRVRRAAGLESDVLREVPIVLMYGRGEGVRCGETMVTPEAVKEGLYADASLAAATTCNFRLAGGPRAAQVKIQLAPGVAASPRLEAQFAQAIQPYAAAPVEAVCREHLAFTEGLETDYERKFDYLDRRRT